MRAASSWVRLHLGVFAVLQQTGVISSSQWLPSPSFFIPCSAASPIPAPPPITSFTPSELLRWTGALALNAAPLAAVYFSQGVWNAVRATVWLSIRLLVPQPHNTVKRSQSRAAETTQTPETPRPSTPTPAAVGEQPRNGRDISRDEMTFRALEGQQPPTDPVAVGAVRRQSTFSARADEYPSDDDETEVVTATLISFDVEASESTDVPPGVWSAELRPNVSEGRSQSGQEPVYRENVLTRLPAVLAADVLTALPVRIITAPSEAIVWRYFVRSFLARRGLGLEGIYGLTFLDSLSWTAAANFLGLELIHLFVEGEIWAVMTMVAQHYRMSEDEWNEQHPEDSNPATE